MPTIAETKEQTITETPLVLFECTLPDGTFERWSTHRIEYLGEAYEAKVLVHNLFEMRAGSEDAIDGVHRLSITLANADSYFSQLSHGNGWKGARVTATFLFYDLKLGVAASESMVLFRGVANPPEEITEATMRLSVTNRMSVQRVLLPEVRIQRRCPWIFPSALDQRVEAVDGGSRGRYSPFFRCGYSADVNDGRGNLSGEEAFTSCDYTRGQCIERGMFDKDSGDQDTRRFGGIEYVPASTLVRSHGESSGHFGAVVDNQARYNDFVPLVYGTAWIHPPVVTAKNDGNLTRMEVLLSGGEINRVLKVVVNDAEIPPGVAGSNMTATGWYNLVTAGTPVGGFNLDFADQNGQPLGDPYGSMAYLSVVVPNRVSEGKATARVNVLLEGLKLGTYGTDGSYLGELFTRSPAWVLFDLLRRSGWAPDELDAKTFATAAAYCDESIAAKDLYGNPVAIPRYGCSLAVRRRRSAADLVRGVRNGAGLYLTYGATGLLELRVEGTLAVQQPAKPPGSNAASAIDGGWPAYEFGDGSNGISGIARRANGESSVRLWYRSTAESPNRYSLEFQDEFNDYQQDSLSLVDIEDAVSGGHEVSATLPALGVPNFHQAARLLRGQLDKSLRGNLLIQFETSVRAVGLRPGDIIAITYLKEGFVRQLFRITRIAPAINHSTAIIEARIHDDDWYRDIAEDGGEVSRRQGWGSGVPRSLIGSVLDENGIPQFGLEEEYQDQGDGTVVVSLKSSFQVPAKPSLAMVAIPHLSLATVIETTGGTLEGGKTRYYALSALDSEGAEGNLSFIVPASIPSGTSTNSVRLEGLRFSTAAAGFHVYRGPNPGQLVQIATHEPLAAMFTDGGLSGSLTGPPDENYDHAKFEWRLELHPLVPATTYSEATIGNSSLQLLPEEHAGKTVRIHEGTGAGQERTILSHSASVVTVAARWHVVPDTTSKFLIVEANWNFGATGGSSPVVFAVPNRGGATVHVCGVAVSERGVESVRELSPVTRWQLGGSAGGTDADVPPAPAYSIAPKGQGAIEVVGIGFPDFTNTGTIRAGTLTLHYWDEVNGASVVSLAEAVDEEATTIEISGGTSQAGDMLQVESEILEVEETVGGGLHAVRRGSHGSTAVAHADATPIYRLDRKVYVIPFPEDFFGSPASGSFSYPVLLPNVRLAAADMFMTNSRGNGETGKVCFTATLDDGVRTFSGGQFTIQVDGYLAIQTSTAPPIVIEQTRPIRDIFAVVAHAPTGAPIELALRVDDVVLCTLSIPIGMTSSDPVNGFGLAPLPAMSRLTLDVVSVGFGIGTTPGEDLTVTVRL